MRVGVDIGGTFTDLVLSDGDQLQIYKLLSTPHDPAQAMLAGLRTIIPAGSERNARVAHGSTVATNAILERRGARTAFIVTRGFRDLLLIGRQHRPQLYALQPQRPAPLIPQRDSYELPERLDHQGDVLLSLDEAALDAILDRIAAGNYESVAVCLLYSFINPDHEQRVRQRILERGLMQDWQIALSSDVLPEFREYERGSTVALEAYVRPVMARYVDHLLQALPPENSLQMMKSDGGIMQAQQVRSHAVQTALSGPAAGVIGAAHLAKLAGFDQIITLDMGGTSTDVALCPGAPQYAPQSQIDGLPLRIRLLDIETIGAGGGSIARVDAGGALRVGPQSAGADPGPVVYGHGGKQITVSDANAMLGRLQPDYFLGGQMTLDIEAARNPMSELAQQAGLDPLALARGIVDIANTNIDRALRRVSIARGHDPRHFTLVAFGGAGPLHAAEVAERLGIPRVLVPRYPGVLCALGLLVADAVVEVSQAVLAPASRGTVAQVRAFQASLLARARNELTAQGFTEEDIQYVVTLDMRYRGQAHELSVPFRGNVIEGFHAAHEQQYGHAMHDRVVEIVTIRLQATGTVPAPVIKARRMRRSTGIKARIGAAQSPITGETITFYDREHLKPGDVFNGEALVFQLDSTVYIPQDWSAQVDAYDNLLLTPTL